MIWIVIPIFIAIAIIWGRFTYSKGTKAGYEKAKNDVIRIIQEEYKNQQSKK